MGGSKQSFQSAPTTEAPNPAETAAAQYQARLQYDPQVAQMEMDIQRQQIPQQAALYQSMYNQYYPEMARQQQQLQQQLYPQQSQIMEAGAGRALERLQNPNYMTAEEQAAQQADRLRATQNLQESMRTRANLGGGLYGGRSAKAEAESVGQLQNQFQMQDYTNRMNAGQAAQQAANPYLQILYPQVGTQQPNVSPFQYQSAVPSADSLYNAYFQASQPNQVYQQATPSPVWAMLGQGASAKIALKCIPEGSLIDTIKGQKKVEDVKAGEIVYDKENKLVKVLMKYEFDEMPSDNRFLELNFNGKKIVICDMHKIDGIRAKDLDVPKKFVKMDKRSYDLMTAGKDGSYRLNGIGIDSMIPELHELTKALQEVS